MIPRSEAVQRGRECLSMLHDVARNDDSQLGWLYDLAALAPNGPAVECGVHRGGSLACWAGARENRGPIIAVDYKIRPGFGVHMERCGLSPTTLEMNSWEAPAHIGEPVAFVFIDADHGEPFCRDIAAWPPAIMPGGVFVCHDYGAWKSPVVKREVDRWQGVAQWEPLGIVGAAIAFRRPLL